MHNRMFLTQHKDPTSAFYKLFFRRVGEEDFQTYSLRVENEVGVSEASVSLRRSKLTALTRCASLSLLSQSFVHLDLISEFVPPSPPRYSPRPWVGSAVEESSAASLSICSLQLFIIAQTPISSQDNYLRLTQGLIHHALLDNPEQALQLLQVFTTDKYRLF